jgi:hypothetical protein
LDLREFVDRLVEDLFEIGILLGMLQTFFVRFGEFAGARLFPDAVDHSVITRGEQVTLGLVSVDVFHVAPHFLEGILHHVTCLVFIPHVLQDETVQTVCVPLDTIVVFFCGHGSRWGSEISDLIMGRAPGPFVTGQGFNLYY